MAYRATLILGDGIGPEVTAATQRVIEAAGVKIDWEVARAGLGVLKETGNALPKETLDSLIRNKLGLKGPTDTPLGEGHRSANVELRMKLDLYANIRPVKIIPGQITPFKDVDIVVFRQGTEDIYIGEERWVDDAHTIAEAVSRISKFESERIFRHAFEYATKHGRKKVTCAHKANILKLTQGLFLNAGRSISARYPDIVFQDRIVDNMAKELVMYPSEYDVIVLTDMFGDILSDECAGLVGGLGFTPGANIGEGVALFEAVHGTAPDIAGQNKANPSALILSAVMMLEHIGESEAAKKIRESVYQVVFEGRVVTGDAHLLHRVGKPASTTEMTDEIIRKVQS